MKYDESSSLYVTAVNDEQCITVSGRPDILNLFKSTLPESVSVRDVSVNTLYHSPAHVHGVRREVLADLSRRNIMFPTFADIICPIRSTFTGETLEANQKGSLVQSIIDMILIHPVNWDKVTSAVAQSISRAEEAHLVNVGPGLGLIRSIEKALQSGPKLWEVLEKGLNMVTEVEIILLAAADLRIRQMSHTVIGACEPLSGR
jgi:malonyl CoA-acyl carrier protein transacylase